MRIYEIIIEGGKTIKVECDEIEFKDDFRHDTKKEPLCLFEEKRLVGIIKNWISVLDITKKEEEYRKQVL